MSILKHRRLTSSIGLAVIGLLILGVGLYAGSLLAAYALFFMLMRGMI